MSHYSYYGRIDYSCQEEESPSIFKAMMSVVLDIAEPLFSK
jgi:hypothetical protein